MVRALYRTAAAEAEIRAWCEARLRGWTNHETRRIRTAAGEVHVVITGSGSPTVVLVPGTNLCTAAGLELAGALLGRCRVVAVDLPGHPGLSESTRLDDPISAYGAMLDELLDALDISGCILVGHSMGAAAVLAASPTARVAAIVLVDPAGLIKPSLGVGMLGAFLAWTARPRASTSARLLQRLQAPGRPPSPELVEWFTLVGRGCRSTGAPGPSDPQALARWRATTRTVVVGEHDAFFPPSRLTAAVEAGLGVAVRTIAAAGHLLPHEDPEAVADLVTALG
jgi:pimeloyl-ACP methyl ester carboxylesterase